MPTEPEIKPLAYKQRTWFFRLLILTFVLVLPMVVFYATGYRFDLGGTSPIVSTGGMYISVPVADTEIYIDEELVRDIRVFRRASYIQNLSAGIHRVHVQGPGVQTWVKELPVRPHIVTEAEAFNLPVVPQVRLVSEWLLPSGVAVYTDRASTTVATDFSFASGTEAVLATTTVATSTLVANQEHEFVSSLFGTTSANETLMGRVVQNVNNAFTFAETGTTSTTTVATTTKTVRDTRLYESDGEVYVLWLGDREDIPYYFCINHQAASSTKATYGKHVYESIASVLASMPRTESEDRVGRICRTQIRIDRLGQNFLHFDFFPGSTDLVLMHLADGLYVVEVDDRAWQNTQLLYPGSNLEVVVDGEQIFVKDRDYLLEVITEIESS